MRSAISSQDGKFMQKDGSLKPDHPGAVLGVMVKFFENHVQYGFDASVPDFYSSLST